MPSLRLVWWLVAVGVMLAIVAAHRQRPLPRVTDLTTAPDTAVSDVRAIYVQCQGCHGVDAAGIPTFSPPLRGSAVVLGDPTTLARLILEGTITRKEWVQPMPGFSQRLTDAEIAEVLTWLRSSWGHAASPISVAQVAAARRNLP